jgi:peroxiredoxin
MTEQSPSAIDYAELLLQEGKRREACALLAAYLKRNPTSAQAWWTLSRAVETPAQERDCLQRVLVLEPGHAQARARLAQLSPAPSKHIKPFTASLPAERVEKAAAVAPPPSPGAVMDKNEQTAPDWISRAAPDLKPAAPNAGTPPPAALSAGQRAPAAPVQPPPAPARQEPSFAPAWAEPPVPPQGAASQVQKPPRRNKFGVIDVVMIVILLCLVLAVATFFVWQELKRTVMQDVYATQTVAQALTAVPPQTLQPSWTFTLRPSQTPSETPTTVVTSTPSPPSLYTSTWTPIPTDAIGLVVGKYPPDFMLTNAITGEQVSLSTYLGKQPVVLFFWATWCPFCKNEIPYLQAVYQKYQADGLVVLAIDADPTDSLTSVIQTINQYGMTFPVLMDPSGEIGQQYAIEAVPHHIFIGRTGRIVSVAKGGLSEKALEGQVMSIMRVFPTSTP